MLQIINTTVFRDKQSHASRSIVQPFKSETRGINITFEVMEKFDH